MEVVPLRIWYPAMYDKWQARLSELARRGIKTVYPLSDRIGWVIHHTVGGTGMDPLRYARSVADYHWRLWTRPGGYNFLTGEDGRVREMCGYTSLGAHAGDNEWNRKTLGLSFQGDFRTRPPSNRMLTSGGEFIGETSIPHTQWTHRQVRPTPTTCPGDAFIRLLPLETDMATAKEIVDELMTRKIKAGPTFGLAFDRVYRNVDELIAAHRAGTLGDADLVNISDDDLRAIAKVVNDEEDRRDRQRLG